MAFASTRSAVLALVAFLSLIQISLAVGPPRLIQATNEAGQVVYLSDNRKPALYTGNYGDCLGSSLINVTRFDAAYYKDNMTVLFHLAGNTQLQKESLMSMYGRESLE